MRSTASSPAAKCAAIGARAAAIAAVARVFSSDIDPMMASRVRREFG
jgi:hypothetical protein